MTYFDASHPCPDRPQRDHHHSYPKPQHESPAPANGHAFGDGEGFSAIPAGDEFDQKQRAQRGSDPAQGTEDDAAHYPRDESDGDREPPGALLASLRRDVM